MTNKIYKLSIAILPWVLFFALAIFLLQNSFSYSDSDLGWHLRVGSEILASGQAPTIDHYNYTLSGQGWVDHEWLLNYGMAVIFSRTSFLGLHLFFLFIIAVAIFFVWRRIFNFSLFSKSDSALFVGIFACLSLGLFASRPHLGLRVQEVGLMFLSILFFLFSHFSRYRFWFLSLPLIFMLWANLHGSFLLGLALLFAYCLYACLAGFIKNWPIFRKFTISAFSKKDRLFLGLIFIFSLLATLVNPYGLGLYSFLGSYANTLYMTYIQEWQSQFILPLYYPQLCYLAFAAAFFLYLWNFGKRLSFSLWDWALAILFFIMAFRSRRHFPIFVIASLPLMSAVVQEFINNFSWPLKKIWLFRLGITGLLLVGAFALWLGFSLPWQQDGIRDFCGKKYPCAAVSYLQSRPETSSWRLFNEYNWGGFLLFAYPEKELFIDGRMPQAPYRGWTILEEYLAFRNPDSDFTFLLSDYDIRLVLIKQVRPPLRLRESEKLFFQVTEQELIVDNPLYSYLSQSSDWRVVFSDNLSIIYERVQ